MSHEIRYCRNDPLPYLFVCAFIANAASFVLPISNPANLVMFGERMPALPEWFRYFALPSAGSIAATFVLLRISQRDSLRGGVNTSRGSTVAMSRAAAIVAVGIAATALVLLVASTLDRDLGIPTFVCGALLAPVCSELAVLLYRSSRLQRTAFTAHSTRALLESFRYSVVICASLTTLAQRGRSLAIRSARR